ncbi:hypothetical protein, partial [Croceibacterium ferulae]|uniref:hypothetical protein n=1 Tax=Croceibacterium ferulae TaxID=1854641 RepID=UPI0019D46AE4
MNRIIPLLLAYATCACSPSDTADREAEAGAPVRVASSGKTDVPLAEVPAQVLAAARAARAGFTAAEAQAETRDGRRY